MPVADLDRQGQPGQGTDPAQASQPAHQRGELGLGGQLSDRDVESVAARPDGQNRLAVEWNVSRVASVISCGAAS
ncbi:MAG TPA: hypothetical protein VHR39_15290 [Propionibacteriaceae bacterium]|nr:hypothetical protein [Propionibacteriaceae bacterium]